LKKIIVLAIVAIIIAAGCGLVVVQTSVDNFGRQMYHQSDTNLYGVGTSHYDAAVTPIDPPGNYPVQANLSQTVTLQYDWEYCHLNKESNQNTTLSYSGPGMCNPGALAVVNTETIQYNMGEVTTQDINLGVGSIWTNQTITKPVWP
jgi:hypothetical protein